MVSKKYIAIYLFLALVPIIALGIVYPTLPEMVAVRNNGKSPEDFENKITLWLLPVLTVLFAILGMFIPKLESKKLLSVNREITEKVSVFVLLMFDLVFAIGLNMASGAIDVNLGLIVLVVSILPILFIIAVGFIQSKSKN